jgi:hypothetical protein
MRIGTDSPFAPRSPWFSMPVSGRSEADIRMGPIQIAVAETPVPRLGMRLAAPLPNPLRTHTDLRYSVPYRGRVLLRVFDVQGRLVSEVADRVATPGWHEARWNGRDRDGVRLPAGVYFARLDFQGAVITTKIVILP